MPYKDKEKQAEAQRRSYQKRKEFYSERTRQRRVDATAYVGKIKEENPCVDCGQYFLACQMQFDHINPDKVRSVSEMIRYSVLSKVLEEIAKCELVCANCHSLRTWKRKTTPALPN